MMAQMAAKTDIEQFIERHWLQWSDSNGYLGVAPPYRTDCPPMWFIGGRTPPADARPLVVLSLEPLVDLNHFDRQVAFSTAGADAYCRWQLDFFDLFPTAELAGDVPQAYWRTMFNLVAGYVGAPAAFSWGIFRDVYVELPLVPLHAPGHNPSAFRLAASTLTDLLHERLRLLSARWPRAVFFCAGAPVADALPAAPGVPDVPLDLPAEAAARREELGNALFTRPIVRRSVAIGDTENVEVFVRRAPFGQGHQPTDEGLYVLGTALRTA